MSETNTPCPSCKGIYVYPMDSLMVCPECGHEWNPEELELENNTQIKDAN